MLVPSDDGVVAALREELVRGRSGSSAMSDCRLLMSESVDPTTCGAAIAAGKKARIAPILFVEFVTAHCCSCAFFGRVCSSPSLPVLA
jgi:hypothetical protein